MRILPLTAAIAVLFSVTVRIIPAADNELTPEEKAAGWRLLFNGTYGDDWKTNKGETPKSPIENGCLMPNKAGGYLVIHKDQFGDFTLKCDVRTTVPCNSGIFFRVGNPADAVQTGFEMQVYSGKGVSKHDFGAIYDAAAPAKNNARKPGEWNAVAITCKGPKITVAVNGETVTTMNCDDYTTAGLNPDRTKNKFKKPIKDFPRKGYIGFQDHDTKCWYKNIKILEQ